MNLLKMDKGAYFIAGIDTDIGKTYFTGTLAKCLLAKEQSVITQKLIQTGCYTRYADDVLKHRQIMNVALMEQDLANLTMPAVFSYPCSPHLAANLENKTIDCHALHQATCALQKAFEYVLIEGAGGLFVPLSEDFLLIDYIQKYNYPVILVTSGRLGSINHTLLSLEALASRDLTVYALAYNGFFDHQDSVIANETKRYLKAYLNNKFKYAQWCEF